MSALSDILASDPDDSPATRDPSAPPSATLKSSLLPPPPPPPPTSQQPADAATSEDPRPSSPMPTSTPRKPDLVDDEAISTPRDESTAMLDETFVEEPSTAAAATSAKRNATGGASSANSGKIRYLKKKDGIPLWRKDIQYDFLTLVFHDETRCFTKYTDGSKGHTFAQVYVEAMARSSKCSKVLKEKLLQGQEGAISMAMVCLLVNVGRMNTTLNFFPEMRAQLRTYHSIPSLQAHQDPTAYKQLQDAPRLKSILKGATEDSLQPGTLEELKRRSMPRTNPVHLVFVLSHYAAKISEQHFPSGGDFYDLIMRDSLSSASRARAFLWLMWYYLEGDFTATAATENPFGPGQAPKGQPDALPLEVPPLESLTEKQAALENVDTEEEKEYGERKRKERIAIVASEPSAAMTALKRARKAHWLSAPGGSHASDEDGSDAGWYRGSEQKPQVDRMDTGSEHSRSPSPATGRGFQAVNPKSGGDMRINNFLNSDDVMDGSPPRASQASSAAPVKKGPGRGNWRRKRGADVAGLSGGRASLDGSHHVPLLPNTGQINFVNEGPHQMETSGSYQFANLTAKAVGSPSHRSSAFSQIPKDHVPTPSYQAQKRNRGITQHQSAVINHRKLQIDYTLDRRIRRLHARSRNKRGTESALIRAWQQVRSMPPDYDSEEEAVRIRRAKERSDRTEDAFWHSSHRGKENNDDYVDSIELWRRPRLLMSGFIRASGETNDIGEEAKSFAQTFRRCARRVERWQEADLPAQTMLYRRTHPIFATHPPPVPSKDPSPEPDEYEFVPKSAPSRRGGGRSAAGRARSRASRSYRSRANGGKTARKIKVEQDADEPADEPADDDDAGAGADVDDEDREVLGEADADESEDEDGDEEMDDA